MRGTLVVLDRFGRAMTAREVAGALREDLRRAVRAVAVAEMAQAQQQAVIDKFAGKLVHWRNPMADMRAWRRSDALPMEVRAGVGDGAEAEFVISTGGMKRDNAVLELDGLQVERYLRNPVVLWVHDYYGLPIGQTTRLQLSPRKMTGRVRWAPTEQAQKIRALVEEGFLRAASLAWRPIRVEPLHDDDGEFVGWHYLESELLEWSVVPVPADADAVRPGPLAGLEQGRALADARRPFVVVA